MVTAYVTGAEVLAFVKEPAPADSANVAWAAKCAASVNARIETRLDGVAVVADSAADAEIRGAALLDAAAQYIARNAPHGVLSLGPEGEAVRLGADVERALRPVLDRYGTRGIG